MRCQIALFILSIAACSAQRPEDAVISVLKQMEKAEQTGDGEAWFALWSSKSQIAAHP